MKVAPLAILKAVRPPSLLKVLFQILINEVLGERLVVKACFLKTTISIGVTHEAINALEASEESKMLTN